MIPITIRHGSEYWKIHDDGAIERPGLVKPDKETWRVVGAVRYNNFGNEVHHYCLAYILEHGRSMQWKYDNGKQRIHIMDVDHGTLRVWMNPTHEVV